MKINLYTTFYKDANQDRMNELLFCVNKNLSGVFDKVTFLVDSRDDNSDYYGGAINMKLKNLIDYLKTKNIFLQPIIDKKIEIIVPSDQENWIYENEKIKTI
jgi:hypothetical protein